MNPNPFAELQAWATACRNLGADPAQLAAYENLAQARYANSAIVAEAREAAHQALQRGEPLPEDPETALRAMWDRRRLARSIGHNGRREKGDKVFVTADNFGSPAVIIEIREGERFDTSPASHYKVRTDSGDAFWAFDFEVSDPIQEAGGT